jgi:hypothetical protein
MRLFLLLCLCWISTTSAQELTICYNYGCATQASIDLSGPMLLKIGHNFQDVASDEEERYTIAYVIGLLEFFAGQQTPTRNDRGGNINDDGVDGRMDCIDHAHNTTTYLRLLAEHGWLKFHRVLEPAKRAPLLVDDHWAARIEDTSNGDQYAVDSWFYDNGHPAVILPLEDWLHGSIPVDFQ